MSDKPKKWLHYAGALGSKPKEVQYGGMDYVFAAGQATSVDAELADNAQYRYAPDLVIVSEEEARAINAAAEAAQAAAAAPVPDALDAALARKEPKEPKKRTRKPAAARTKKGK